MTKSIFRLIPLDCGHCLLGENHLLGEPHSDNARVPFTLYSFLADGGPDRRVLIDLGPIGLDYLNTMFHRYHFFRHLPGEPDAITQPKGNLFDWLRRLGLRPEDINHIVFTHLHADHHGLDDGKDGGAILRFPNARIHASRIGWETNLSRREGDRWNSYVDYAFSDFLLQAERDGQVVFHDNDEVVPGVDVIYLGGHSFCSQAVRVQTAAGPAIVTSDEVYQYQILQSGTIGRLRTTPQRLLEATTKLVDLALAGHILLPCHEPALAEFWECHGDQWLRAIKPASDNAARSFRQALKQTLTVS